MSAALLSDLQLSRELTLQPAISRRAAATIAARYSDPRTPTGQTFKAISEGRHVPRTLAVAAVEYELSKDPSSAQLEALQEWAWS